MIAGAQKRTIKNTTIRPFQISGDNTWERIEYRYDSAESWRNALMNPFVVLPNTLQDARRDAIHELRIGVDIGNLKGAGHRPENVDLVVLTRDNFSKKILVFSRQSLSDDSEIFLTIPRDEIELTSLSRRIDFEIMLLVRETVELNGKFVRQSARLAKHVVSVSADSKGVSFNFIKTSPDEFVQRGMPGTTTFHLEIDDAVNLVEQCDDISSVLKVMVHEDAWLTLQEIRSGNQAGEALGTMMGSELVLSVLGAVRTRTDLNEASIEEGSLIHRILGWLAAHGKRPPDDFKAILFDENGLRLIQAYVQDALKLTRKIKRVRLEDEDGE